MSDMDDALALTHVVMSNFRDAPCRCVPNKQGTHDAGCAPFTFLSERGRVLIGMRQDRARLLAEEGVPQAPAPKLDPRHTLPW